MRFWWLFYYEHDKILLKKKNKKELTFPSMTMGEDNNGDNEDVEDNDTFESIEKITILPLTM